MELKNAVFCVESVLFCDESVKSAAFEGFLLAKMHNVVYIT
jgi:hypothetical protein